MLRVIGVDVLMNNKCAKFDRARTMHIDAPTCFVRCTLEMAARLTEPTIPRAVTTSNTIAINAIY